MSPIAIFPKLPPSAAASSAASAATSSAALCRFLASFLAISAVTFLTILYYHGASFPSTPLHDLLLPSSAFSIDSDSVSTLPFHHPISDPCSPSDLQQCKDIRLRRLLKEWDDFLRSDGDPQGAMAMQATVVRPPYWENCSQKAEEYKELDRRGSDGSSPKWTLWKGNLRYPLPAEPIYVVNSPEPPWVQGGDADNYPLTRRVQADLWLHQHPTNCNDEDLKFMWVNWENGSGFGLGARIKCMIAFFAIAFRENRILVSDSFGRADHAGCQGESRNQWDCYFLPETTKECKIRAMELRNSPEAWAKGIITDNRNYTWDQMWSSPISEKWGSPWEYMQPTAEVQGELMRHPAGDRRWWRAQGIRYLMRFPSEYTCRLMNNARHQYFGAIAAQNMLSAFPTTDNETTSSYMVGDMEKIVWASKRPWIPRPMISMHVRLGDKAREMEMVPYNKYMELASRLRISFPDATNIWLATEMEDVITESMNYTNWNIYYTNITRQTGETSMFDYEASIGIEASTNNGFVNFLMALESDFFIGPLGSTWSLLLDCMRATNGKLMSGFLSVNRDTFW